MITIPISSTQMRKSQYDVLISHSTLSSADDLSQGTSRIENNPVSVALDTACIDRVIYTAIGSGGSA
jgi:hypothetical protein